jgi:hypothetical protein
LTARLAAAQEALQEKHAGPDLHDLLRNGDWLTT